MTNSTSNHESNVTIDDLTIMIANGFRGVDKRFVELEDRLTGKIDSLESRFDSLESMVDQMDMRLTSQIDNIVRV